MTHSPSRVLKDSALYRRYSLLVLSLSVMHRVIYVSIFSCNLKYITFAGSAVLFAVAHDFAHHVARLWVNFFREMNEFELNVAKRGGKATGVEPLPRSMTKTS